MERPKIPRLSRRLGQHLVTDEGILRRMVEYARISPSDIVLEIGTGLGNLTKFLSEKAGKVYTIEMDARLLAIAKENVSSKNVVFIHGDARKVELPEFTKVVANLPYKISSDITFKLLEKDFELGVLMYQLEFAKRMIAKPGAPDYGRLSVNVFCKADVEILEELPPEVFFPPPAVCSAIVRLRPRPPPFEIANWNLFSRVVEALFQHRKQKVRNALIHSSGRLFPSMHKKELKNFLIRFPNDLLERRVFELKPEDFERIARLLTSP
ncbi:MAG: 16S rRNA (adenine(1518)-N(6)/adenine(1519)-N(6))-dimethyltransferase RsmA [Candidatus Hadarchaeales archaeon]